MKLQRSNTNQSIIIQQITKQLRSVINRFINNRIHFELIDLSQTGETELK